MSRIVDSIRGRKVDVLQSEIVKIGPSMPPRRGEIVLVNGDRCRVTSATVKWDGPRWTLLGLRVKDARMVCPSCGRRWSGSHECGGIWEREVRDPGDRQPPAPPPEPHR